MVAAVEEREDPLVVVGTAQDAVEAGDRVELAAAPDEFVDLTTYGLGRGVPIGPALERRDGGADDVFPCRMRPFGAPDATETCLSHGGAPPATEVRNCLRISGG
ncbi:hypothetical protein [Streptomyces sp. NPDC007960]|uniref:hypothetical protein n=1 Tax=Streptomyces sp. NPDC007960 TaxID=3364798 RepID=UPI0036E0534E